METENRCVEIERPPSSCSRRPRRYRWDSAETDGWRCRQLGKRACQFGSSWSRDDHEDGGPTIRMPAADARCTLWYLRSCNQYTPKQRRTMLVDATPVPVEFAKNDTTIPAVRTRRSGMQRRSAWPPLTSDGVQCLPQTAVHLTILSSLPYHRDRSSAKRNPQTHGVGPPRHRAAGGRCAGRSE